MQRAAAGEAPFSSRTITSTRLPGSLWASVASFGLTGASPATPPAAGAEVAMVLTHGPGTVVLEVTNGPGAAAPSGAGSGMGLVGMRERVESTGGRLCTGARRDGGFEVVATWNGRR